MMHSVLKPTFSILTHCVGLKSLKNSLLALFVVPTLKTFSVTAMNLNSLSLSLSFSLSPSLSVYLPLWVCVFSFKCVPFTRVFCAYWHSYTLMQTDCTLFMSKYNAYPSEWEFILFFCSVQVIYSSGDCFRISWQWNLYLQSFQYERQRISTVKKQTKRNTIPHVTCPLLNPSARI